MQTISFTLRHKLLSALLDVNVKGFRKIAHHLPNLIIPKPTSAVILKTIHGLKIIIDPIKDVGLERNLYYTGTYEKGTLHVIQEVLKRGEGFIDVGANIGLMSLIGAKTLGERGRVYAFEPHPKTLEILRENISLNAFNNIEVFDNAVGSEKGVAQIYDQWVASRGSATMVKPENETEHYEVQVVRLDECFGRHNSPISLIKIDIEGFELDALKGAKNTILDHEPVLIIECSELRNNSHEDGASAVFQFIVGLRAEYHIYKLSGGMERISKLIKVEREEDLPVHDNLFCFTKKWLSKLPGSMFKE